MYRDAQAEGTVPITTTSPDPSTLVACTECDALYDAPPAGERFSCARCHAVIARPEWFSGTAVLVLAVVTLGLVAGVCFFPFLSVRAVGLGNAASLFDAILVFTGGQLAILGWAVAALILLIPAARMALLIYVLGPVTFGLNPARLAAPAFALSEKLRPWSMIEVFALGGAVSLIKVAGEAKVNFGPAFWMFIALVVVVIVQERFMCRWSVWNRLTPAHP